MMYWLQATLGYGGDIAVRRGSPPPDVADSDCGEVGGDIDRGDLGGDRHEGARGVVGALVLTISLRLEGKQLGASTATSAGLAGRR